MTDNVFALGEEGRLAEASDWVVRLQQADLSDADGLAFDAWLDAHPDNARAYDRALATWNAYGGAAQGVLKEIAAVERRRPRGGFDRRWLIGAGGLAAAATVALAVLPQLMMRPSVETYATAKGEHRTIRLADGSTVDLNADTRMTVTLAGRERRVAMGEGEAVFDVAADSRRPFVIEAGDHAVRVVGTQFDVRNRKNGLAVTVTRGLVEVRPSRPGAGGRAYMIRPGQRLDLRSDQPAQVSAVTPDEALSWRTGRVVYRAEKLSNVIADLNRQFTQPLQIADPELADMRVSGVLVIDQQPQVVQRLTLMLPITAVPSDGGVLLRRR